MDTERKPDARIEAAARIAWHALFVRPDARTVQEKAALALTGGNREQGEAAA
jgi:hypothetical protein